MSFKAAKCQAIKLLNEYPDLEVTEVHNGGFLDYYGMPYCDSYMLPEIPYIDIAACKAAIPGTGDEKIVLTYTKDVARCVRKMVESDEKWPAVTRLAGDFTTLNEVLEVAERVRGKLRANQSKMTDSGTQLGQVPNSKSSIILWKICVLARFLRFPHMSHSMM